MSDETCTRCQGNPREVCDACGEHSCWEGEFMCHEAWADGRWHLVARVGGAA